MSTKVKVIIVIVGLVTAAAVGRWTAPEKVRVETKTVEVEKESTKTNIDKDVKKITTTTTTKKPDGTVSTTTVTTSEDTSKINRDKEDDKTVTSDTVKEVTRSSSKLILSAMAGASVTSLSTSIYGGSIQKSVLGPITVGAWGMSNGTAGLSLGLLF